jgi:hypothetical protein
VTASDFNKKLQEHGCAKGVAVQKVCRLAKDEDEIRRTLDYIWSDSEGASRVLKELQNSNEDSYKFENKLESVKK